MPYISKPILTALVMTLISYSVNAQVDAKNKTDSLQTFSWLSKRFAFDRPDTNFVSLSDEIGYTNERLSATIKAISFPAKIADVRRGFLSDQTKENSVLLDTLSCQTNGRHTFTVITEEISPDSTIYENYVTIITVVGFENVTAVVVGAYPKSKDSLLRKKFIQAGLSVREE